MLYCCYTPEWDFAVGVHAATTTTNSWYRPSSSLRWMGCIHLSHPIAEFAPGNLVVVVHEQPFTSVISMRGNDRCWWWRTQNTPWFLEPIFLLTLLVLEVLFHGQYVDHHSSESLVYNNHPIQGCGDRLSKILRIQIEKAFWPIWYAFHLKLGL